MINRTDRTVLAAVAGLILVGAAANPAGAATATGRQGGYRVTPSTVRSAAVEMHAPKVNCARATHPGSLRLGLFGSSAGHGWYLAVIASCHDGAARYRAEFSEDVGQSPLTVHRGDLIRLIIEPGPEYEIDNLTTGAAEGGASSSPGGGTPALAHVVIGGHVQGAFPGGTRATLRAAKVNKTPLGQVMHQRQVQQRGGERLVVAGRLDHAGAAFRVTTK